MSRLARYRKAVAAAVATAVGAGASAAVVLLPMLHGDAQRYAVALIALATVLGVPLAVAKAPANAVPSDRASDGSTWPPVTTSTTGDAYGRLTGPGVTVHRTRPDVQRYDAPPRVITGGLDDPADKLQP